MTACSNAASSAAGVATSVAVVSRSRGETVIAVGQPGPPLRVGQPGQVLAVGVEQLEAEQAHRHVAYRLVDAVLAPAEHDLLERAQLPGGRVEGDDLALEDRLAGAQPGRQQLDDVGELGADAAPAAG